MDPGADRIFRLVLVRLRKGAKQQERAKQLAMNSSSWLCPYIYWLSCRLPTTDGPTGPAFPPSLPQCRQSTTLSTAMAIISNNRPVCTTTNISNNRILQHYITSGPYSTGRLADHYLQWILQQQQQQQRQQLAQSCSLSKSSSSPIGHQAFDWQFKTKTRMNTVPRWANSSRVLHLLAHGGRGLDTNQLWQA